MRQRAREQKHNALSVKLLLSYLSILVVPLLTIAVIYNTATGFMYSVQQSRMSAALQATAAETQRSLQEAANLSTYISTMPELGKMHKMIQNVGKASFYQMYSLCQSFPNYTLFNTAIKNVYFFFPGQEYVMCLPGVVPANEQSYATIKGNLKAGYSDMLQMLGTQYRDISIVVLDTIGPDKQLAIMQSFPNAMYDSPLGTMLVLLDSRNIDSRLNANLIDGYGLVLMQGEDGGIIKTLAGKNNRLNAEQLDLAALSQSGESTVRIQGEQYAVCCAKINGTGQMLYSIVPKQVLVQKTGLIKLVIAFLSVLSVITGLVACVVLWNRRRHVVLRYSSFEKEYGTVAKAGNNMWDGLHAVMDSFAQMETTVRLQNTMLRSGVIHKLLEGGYTETELLKKDLHAAGIRLEGALYCVAAVTFNRGFVKISKETMNEFRLRMLKRVSEGLSMPNYCCEPEDMYIAVIIPLAGLHALPLVKEQLLQLEDMLITQENIQAYIGIGNPVQNVMQISDSYYQAHDVCEYLRFYNIRAVMDVNGMPSCRDSFYFPLEMELRLIRTIEQGNLFGLQELFGELAVENFTSRQLSYDMHKHLIELVRATAVRALRGMQGAAGEALLEALAKADNLEQIYVLLEEAMPCAAQHITQKEDRKTDARKEEIRRKLEENYSRQDLTIDAMAGQLGLPEARFYKEFKQLFGVSFSEALENLRIEKACELLQGQTLIKEVSEMVGYSSDYSFRRAFKRVTGITPSAYMENYSSK